MATRFDSFTGPEMMCIVASLCSYEATQAFQSNYCPSHGAAPSRDALIYEAMNATNFIAGSYPDLLGLDIGADFQQGP
jgi:hypothetical protein